jgi:hypothetical protein
MWSGLPRYFPACAHDSRQVLTFPIFPLDAQSDALHVKWGKTRSSFYLWLLRLRACFGIGKHDGPTRVSERERGLRGYGFAVEAPTKRA